MGAMNLGSRCWDHRLLDERCLLCLSLLRHQQLAMMASCRPEGAQDRADHLYLWLMVVLGHAQEAVQVREE